MITIFILILATLSAFFVSVGKSVGLVEDYQATMLMLGFAVFFLFKRGQYIGYTSFCSQLSALIVHYAEIKS